MNETNGPVELLPDEPSAPWWLEDIEDYLELLHGDADSLCEQHRRKTNRPAQSHHKDNPKVCPGCLTVFHATKKGGCDACPFCHGPINFVII